MSYLAFWASVKKKKMRGTVSCGLWFDASFNVGLPILSLSQPLVKFNSVSAIAFTFFLSLSLSHYL